MKVFKYLDENGALETIKSNSVLLSTPSKYNDPFDCDFSTSKEEMKKAYNLFLNYQLFKNFYTVLFENNKQNVHLRTMAKACRIPVGRAAKETKKSKEYVGQAFLLPFCSKIYKYLKKKKQELVKEFNGIIEKWFVTIKKSVLVSCFGSNNNSVLMWSHYANKHKGACIEYDIDDNDFQPVTYKDEKPEFELSKALSVFFGHEFAGEKKYDIDKYWFLIQPLLIKSKDWEYEGEIRCIYSKKKGDPKIHKKKTRKGKRLILLLMPKIKAVYVGCQANKSFENKIKDACGNIPKYKMKKAKNKYGLEFDRFD